MFSRTIPGYRPRNNIVACDGDSITNHNTYNNVLSTVWSPTNQYNWYMSYGWLSWLRVLTRQSFQFDGTQNFGVVGDTTAQILARLPSVLSASNAATRVYWGGINDRGSSGLTLAQSKANFDATIKLYATTGTVDVLIVMLPPFSGDTTFTAQGLTTTQLKQNHAFRQYIVEAYSGYPWIMIVDPAVAYADPTSTVGYNIVGKTGEGLHPYTTGAFDIACLLLPIFQKLFPLKTQTILPLASDTYDSVYNPNGLLTLNPNFTGASGTLNTNGSGPLGTSWAGNTSGDTACTRVYSQPVTTGFTGVGYEANGPYVNAGGPESKTWQQCVFSGTPTATTEVPLFYQSLSNTSIGDLVYGFAEFEIDAGAIGFGPMCLKLTGGGATLGIGAADMYYYNPTGLGVGPSKAYSGVLRTPPLLVTAATPVVMTLSIQVTNAVAGSFTTRVRSAGSRKYFTT